MIKYLGKQNNDLYHEDSHLYTSELFFWHDQETDKILHFETASIVESGADGGILFAIETNRNHKIDLEKITELPNFDFLELLDFENPEPDNVFIQVNIVKMKGVDGQLPKEIQTNFQRDFNSLDEFKEVLTNIYELI